MLPLKIFSLCFLTVILLSLAASLAQATHGNNATVPALQLDLPANALGKDYRPLWRPVGLPPSGRGVQVSILGVAGITLGAEEGIEFNLLGLSAGIGFSPFRLRLPFIGGLGSNNLQENKI